VNIRQKSIIILHTSCGRQWRRLASEVMNMNTRHGHGDWTGKAIYLSIYLPLPHKTSV